MLSYKELIQLLLIVIVIGLPPYLVAVKTFKGQNPVIFAILSIIYWSGTIYTQQIIPFVLIIILLIKNIRDKRVQRDFRDTIQRERFTFKDFITISVVTILIRFPIGFINVFYVLVVDYLGFNIQQQEVVDIFVNSQSNLLNTFLILLVVIVAPLNEEFSMRHWLYGDMLSPRTGSIVAALISSSLFTLLHYNIAGIPTFFILGMYACYVYYRKGLWGAVTVHFTFNLSSVVLLMFTKHLLPLG